MKVVSRFLICSVFVLNAFPVFAQTDSSGDATANAAATPADSIVSQTSKLMGQDLSVSHADGVTSTQSGVNSTTQVKLLGHQATIMQTTLEQLATPTPAQTAEAAITTTGATSIDTSSLAGDAIAAATSASSMYIAGKRVWTGTFTQQGQSLVYTGGIAPTQIPIPIILYPVGPLILEVDAGVDYQANLVASLTPPAGILSAASPSATPSSTFTIPSNLTNTLGIASAAIAVVGDLTTPSTDPISSASINVSASGSAYIEGYARLLFVRAGLGGAVTVIDGRALVAAQFFQSAPPQLQYNGVLTLLSGHVYAFLDTNLIFSWTRLWTHDFFKWSGKCFAFGGDVCGLN